MTESSKPVINPWIIAISVMLGTFMEVLDTTVVNVSLQHIAGSLSVTPEEATWVLTSYLVANAIVLPLTGWLANYFGRRNILLLSVGGFTLFSFLCGIAPNLPLLVMFRGVQGARAGARRLDHRQLLLAPALLHQHSHRRARHRHVDALHSRSAIYQARRGRH